MNGTDIAFDIKEMADMAYKGLGMTKDIKKAIVFMNVAISRLDNANSFHKCSFNNFLANLYCENKENYRIA